MVAPSRGFGGAILVGRRLLATSLAVEAMRFWVEMCEVGKGEGRFDREEFFLGEDRVYIVVAGHS